MEKHKVAGRKYLGHRRRKNKKRYQMAMMAMIRLNIGGAVKMKDLGQVKTEENRDAYHCERQDSHGHNKISTIKRKSYQKRMTYGLASRMSLFDRCTVATQIWMRRDGKTQIEALPKRTLLMNDSAPRQILLILMTLRNT